MGIKKNCLVTSLNILIWENSLRLLQVWKETIVFNEVFRIMASYPKNIPGTFLEATACNKKTKNLEKKTVRGGRVV